MKKTAFKRLIQKIASGEKEKQNPRFATADETAEEAIELALDWTPESGLNRKELIMLSDPERTDDGGVSAWFDYGPERGARRSSAYDVLDESGVTDEDAVERLQERFKKFNNGVTVSPENLELTTKDKLKSYLAGAAALGGSLATGFGALLAIKGLEYGDAKTTGVSAAIALGGAGLLASSLLYNNRLKARRVEEFFKAQKDYKEAFSAGLQSPETDYEFIGNVYNGKVDPTIANVAKARGMINAASYSGERYKDMIRALTEAELELDTKESALNPAVAEGNTVKDYLVSHYLDSDEEYPDMADIGYIGKAD